VSSRFRRHGGWRRRPPAAGRIIVWLASLRSELDSDTAILKVRLAASETRMIDRTDPGPAESGSPLCTRLGPGASPTDSDSESESPWAGPTRDSQKSGSTGGPAPGSVPGCTAAWGRAAAPAQRSAGRPCASLAAVLEAAAGAAGLGPGSCRRNTVICIPLARDTDH
jgi:hypothetical protein